MALSLMALPLKISTRNFTSKNLYSTPRYPQSNGQAETTNKTLLSGLKKRLKKAKGNWVEELPGVLWAYRTTPGRPIGNTPFALAYGTNVVIPTEVGMPTARNTVQGQRNEGDEIARHLNWADEAREAAYIRMVTYQQKNTRTSLLRRGASLIPPGRES